MCVEKASVDSVKTYAAAHPSTPLFLVIENLTRNSMHKQYGVLDLKIGTCLYDPDCPEPKKKMLQERAKNTTTGRIGLRLCGLRSPNHLSSAEWILGREDGKYMTSVRLMEVISTFLNELSAIQRDLWIEKLTRLISYVEQQSFPYYLYSSSMLMYFQQSTLQFDFKLIDFVHAVPKSYPGTLENDGYVFGLKHLLKNLSHSK